MALRATLKDIKDLGLDYADMVGSKFAEDSRLNDYANKGLQEVHQLLVNSFEDYIRETHTISVTSGTGEYDLPSNFYKLLGLYYVDGNYDYWVPSFAVKEKSGYRNAPSVNATIRMWYAPQFKKLKNDGDQVEIAAPIMWEDYAALYVAYRLKMKAELPTNEIKAERDRIYALCTEGVDMRDTNDRGRVVDVNSRWGGDTDLTNPPIAVGQLRYAVMGNKILFVQSSEWGL